MSGLAIPLLDFKNGSVRTLHLAWLAFFMSFVLWFGHAPLLAYIKVSFGLSENEIKALLILNVAITIPARILVGMLVDKFGPKHIYSALLAVGGVLCIAFAWAQDFTQLAVTRFLLGFVGAGFVVGIRLVSEWFPARQVGLAEGLYAGWGKFGSALSSALLPLLATAVGAQYGWRVALTVGGLLAMAYALLFFFQVHNTPKGSAYFKPKKSGALEVSSWSDLILYFVLTVPMYLALALLVWRLSPSNLGLLPELWGNVCYALVAALAVIQCRQIWRVNAEPLRAGVPAVQRYKFKQVAILSLSYSATFGSEIALMSMLPLFFMDTFQISAVQAGLMAAVFVVANLVGPAAGGLLSDRIGRRRALGWQLGGVVLGYLLMSQIHGGWPMWLAVVVTLLCSLFVQAGNGGVYAMLPLVKRSLTGQITGMVGAYGNVGSVIFLTVLTLVEPATFFMVIAGSALAVFIAVQFLDEPKGHLVEVLDDGSVHMIEMG